METTLQSSDGMLHTPTFQRNTSTETLGEAEVYEMHSEKNVVPDNFNVLPRQWLMLVVTFTPWGGYM